MKPLLLLLAASVLLASPATKSAPVKMVRVPVSTDTGALKPADFEVTIGGAGKGKVVRVQSPDDDLLLLVVLDLAGDLAFAEPARQALVDEVRQLPTKTRVALMRAQDGLQVLSDPTSDAAVLERSLRAVPITGKPALLDTLEMSAQLGDAIAGKAAVRVAVLYITDGDLRNYRQDFTNPVINSSDSRDLSRRFPEGLIRERISKLEEGLLAHQTPVHIVQVTYASDRLNEAYRNGLMQLSAATGGTATICRSTSEIPESIASAIKRVYGQYSVTVQLTPRSARNVILTITSPEHHLVHRTRYLLR